MVSCPHIGLGLVSERISLSSELASCVVFCLPCSFAQHAWRNGMCRFFGLDPCPMLGAVVFEMLVSETFEVKPMHSGAASSVPAGKSLAK